ncbi:Na+/H+ antiporter subunit E [Orenia marismortui]|uniref:Na+/H+ antiporter subunit E n=1 Tax=Orenia marismortui TaxID=46469 RepID=UPI00036BB5D5|nr:Na+/H+ antiporter subunit E [Orenia marismortui]
MRRINKEEIFAFILLYTVWIIVSGNLSLSSLILGIIVAGTIDFVIVHSSFTRMLSKKVITKFVFLIWYILVVGKEVFIASYKIAYYVINPKTSLKPAIVKVPVKLGKEDRLIKLTILANTITFTPGTVTLDSDINKNELYIHWLNIQSHDNKEIKKIILGDFEIIIRRIFK